MTEIKITELNNKSRKGTYVYIKEKGKHARYYKYTGQAGELDAYKKQFISRKRGIAKEYLKKIRQRPTIQKAIQKGITTSKIKDGIKATNKEIHQAKKKLLKPLILDSKILETMARKENFDKIKERIEYRITAKDNQNKISLTATQFNTTPEKVIQDIKKELKNKKPEYLQLKGKWTGIRTYTGSTITKVEIQMIFRKAK